ncbi:tape measure protein [Phocaeicola plebeius]|uniref:tape measure protein n=1 Tax=Phocaeicola plebeius TaxID=310297 RepID=UPI00195AB9F1|nr:tape measure protein [Phocaeicola plebeius]MBM6845086.1 tape measure protein [Phocaeicola plebeius]
MATLVFRVSAQYDEVIKLRNEISKLEAQLKKMDVNKSPAAAKALETQLASTRQQMMGLVTEAAKAGAVMEKDFKSNIYNASQSVNDFTQKIIDQKRVVKDVEHDVKRLGDAYKTALKRNPTGAAGLLSEYQSAKKTLDEEKATLFGLTQQQAEARLSVKRLKDEYAAFKEEAGETVEANEKMSVSLTKVLGVIGGVTALKNFATELVNVRGQFQQLEIAFSTMLKSKEKADKLMSEMVDIAAKTPFDLQGVASSAKQMIAYGSSAENVGDELVMLGNVAAGVGSQLSEIAYLYGTLRTQGRAYAVDIRQFAGRGIPIYEELAKVLGVTKDEVSGLVKEGKVGFKEVEQAFKNMTSESGIYYNLMQEQSKSLTGQLSNLGDAWDTMLNEIGKDTQGIASAGISGLKGLIENYETVGKILIGLIATYGTYKTALIVVRIAQDTLTARMELAILVTKAQTIAQKALNTVMKANPYVLVATVLAGLVATMWAFHDSTTASEKAQQKFNEEQKNFANQEEERKKKIEELIRVIQDETETEFSKIKAYEELQRYSPALSSAYTREQLAVLNLAEANKELNKERDKNSYENILKNIQQWEEKIKSLNASLKNAGQGAPLIASQIESAKANLNKWKSALSEYNRLKKETEENSKPVEVKLMEARSNREQIIREYNIARQILQEEQEKIKNFPFATIPIDVQIRFNNAQAALKGIDGTISGLESQREASEKSYQQAYKEAKTVYEAKLKAVEDAKKGTESAYKKAVKELEAAEKSYKSLGGVTEDTLTKQENQAKKDAERQKKEQQQVAEELLQLRRTNQQEEINLMKEGSEKKRRQIELDYQREIDEIRKQRKKWEDAQGGKLTSEQREVLGSRASNAMQSREKGLAEITKAENQAAIEANERYLKSYGTFMQKRDAIIAEYTRKISEAATQGDKDILQKEMDKALSSLDLEKLKQGINWELIFGDLDKVSKESLNKVKQQLRDFKNSEEYKNMAVDQKKVIDEALSNIQSTLIDKGGLLADLPEQLSELAKAQEELSQAQEEYNEAMRSGTDEQKEAATKKLNDAQKRQQNAQVNVQKSTDKTTSNLVTLSNVITQLGSNSEISLSQVGDLAGNIVDIFAEESEKLGGIIGAAFSLLDAIGTQGLDGFVGNIFSSVFKSVGGIWDTLTFGGFSKLFGIGGNEKEVQDTINRLTDRNEKLQSAIESLTEEMKSSKGSEKSVAEYNKAIKYQEEYNKNVLAKAQANAGYHSSHHSWAYYMGWSESDIQWIRENVMAEFTGTDSLWQMSPEQMDLLRQNVDLWQKMADSGKGGYGNAVVDALDEYADLAGNLEELKEGLFEQLTGISFDSMYDSFIDTLMDMDASAEDFADNLSEYFMRAMLSDKIGNMYSQKLEDWWNRFGESMKDGNLSESERNSLQNEYMGYVNEALKLRDGLAAATGYDKAGSSSQQSASSRGFGTEMTHEDAGELSGRFTAVYESNLRIETAEQQQTVAITELRGSIGSLTSQVTGLYNIADETRTILANSYLELQQIRENTGEIVKPIKQMQADIAEVKHNTSRL